MVLPPRRAYSLVAAIRQSLASKNNHLLRAPGGAASALRPEVEHSNTSLASEGYAFTNHHRQAALGGPICHRAPLNGFPRT
jgi:hypothetical protein